MRDILTTGRFLRDKKRLKKRGVDFGKLVFVIRQLQIDGPLPLSARPHKLTGEWHGFWECHIEPDWLLIYEVTRNAVLLAGTGSHTDLFR